MPDSQITVYGTYWCPDCVRSKRFLSEQLIKYRWVDLEQDHDAEKIVMALNHGKRIIPTIIFPDGSILVEPSNAQLANKLELKTEAKSTFYDLVIIGGGPAGLTAAIFAAREGVETLLVERSALGGQAAITGGIENFPGFPEGITGQDFANRISQQAQRFGVELLQAQEVISIENDTSCFCIKNADGRLIHASAFLIATGATYRRLEVPGEHLCGCGDPFLRHLRRPIL